MASARGLGPSSVGARRGSKGQDRSRAAREAAGLHRAVAAWLTVAPLTSHWWFFWIWLDSREKIALNPEAFPSISSLEGKNCIRCALSAPLNLGDVSDVIIN